MAYLARTCNMTSLASAKTRTDGEDSSLVVVVIAGCGDMPDAIIRDGCGHKLSCGANTTPTTLYEASLAI
jgi:hypothetical protein